MLPIIAEYPDFYQNRIERQCDNRGACELNRTGKKNRIIGLMAGISIGFAVWGSVRPEPDLWQGAESMLAESSRPVSETKQQLSLHSLSAVLMDADSGRILYGKDEHQVRPMASTGAWKSGGFL